MIRPQILDSFGEVPGLTSEEEGAAEVEITIAGAADRKIAIAAFAVVLRHGSMRGAYVATSVVRSEIEVEYLPSPFRPAPMNRLGAEWYALTFAVNRFQKSKSIVVQSELREVIDVLRGARPVSRHHWLLQRQLFVMNKCAMRRLRVNGRYEYHVRTQGDPERDRDLDPFGQPWPRLVQGPKSKRWEVKPQRPIMTPRLVSRSVTAALVEVARVRLLALRDAGV